MPMKERRFGLWSAIGVSLLTLSGAIRAHEEEKATLTYKSCPKWTIDLPKETMSPVNGVIPIAHTGGNGFAALIDGTALAVDTNADGRPDVKAKGTKAFMTLKGKNDLGREFAYSVRLVNEGGWKFAASGMMIGRVKGVDVRLIDQDNNGRYNDFGIDAMIVGSGDAASFLSKIVNLDGELYALDVSTDGAEISLAKFDGESGTLNLSAYETQGDLASAVVSSMDDSVSFNLANAKQGIRVPTGEYKIVHGTVVAGSESAVIRAGKMKNLVVKSGEATNLAWGGPLRAEVTWTHQNGTLTIAPENLAYYGKAGEQYTNWKPDGQTPTFIVNDAKTGKEITKARFGGC